MYFFEVFLPHDDIIIFMLSFNNSSLISFCQTQCMPLATFLMLFEILIVDRQDCTYFLRSTGLSWLPVLAFATAGSKMVRWANGVLSGDLRSLLSLFLETLSNTPDRWKTVKLKSFPN